MKTLEGTDKFHLDRAYDDVANGRVKRNDDRVYVYTSGLLADQPADWNQLVWECHKSRDDFEAAAKEWSRKRQYRYVIDDRTDPEQVVQAFTRFINAGHFADEKKFAERLARDHRTLQQGAMRVFLEFCRILAENHKEGWYDGRNVDSCEAAVAIVNATKDMVIRFI